MTDIARRASWAAAFLALAAVAAGCGPRSVALYEKVMGPLLWAVTESATRTREVNDGLETRFILSATWLSGSWSRRSPKSIPTSTTSTRRGGAGDHPLARESEKYVRFLRRPLRTGREGERPGETRNALEPSRRAADEKDFEPVYIRKSSLRPEEISRFFPYSGRGTGVRGRVPGGGG